MGWMSVYGTAICVPLMGPLSGHPLRNSIFRPTVGTVGVWQFGDAIPAHLEHMTSMCKGPSLKQRTFATVFLLTSQITSQSTEVYPLQDILRITWYTEDFLPPVVNESASVGRDADWESNRGDKRGINNIQGAFKWRVSISRNEKKGGSIEQGAFRSALRGSMSFLWLRMMFDSTYVHNTLFALTVYAQRMLNELISEFLLHVGREMVVFI